MCLALLVPAFGGWLATGCGIPPPAAAPCCAEYDWVYHASQVPLEPNTRVTVGLGASVSALEVHAAAKLRAWMFSFVSELFKEQQVAADDAACHHRCPPLRQNSRQFLTAAAAPAQLDAIVSPTVATRVPLMEREAFKFGESNTPLVMKVMRYVNLANFIGLPGSRPHFPVPAVAWA